MHTSLKSDHYLRANANQLLNKESRYSFPKLFLKATRQTLYFRFPLVSEKLLIINKYQIAHLNNNIKKNNERTINSPWLYNLYKNIKSYPDFVEVLLFRASASFSFLIEILSREMKCKEYT